MRRNTHAAKPMSGANVVITKKSKALLEKCGLYMKMKSSNIFHAILSGKEIEQLAILTARLIENPD